MNAPPGTRAEPIRRDWLAKTLAGVLLGFSFAMLCSGLLLAAMSSLPPGVRAQYAMWIVVPIWFAVLAACYAVRSGLRVWLWLGGANLIAGTLLAVVQHL